MCRVEGMVGPGRGVVTGTLAGGLAGATKAGMLGHTARWSRCLGLIICDFFLVRAFLIIIVVIVIIVVVVFARQRSQLRFRRQDDVLS